MFLTAALFHGSWKSYGAFSRALKREHSALQNMKFLHFLFLWVIFALLDPDPLT
jgi:hypothetical protein